MGAYAVALCGPYAETLCGPISSAFSSKLRCHLRPYAESRKSLMRKPYAPKDLMPGVQPYAPKELTKVFTA